MTQKAESNPSLVGRFGGVLLAVVLLAVLGLASWHQLERSRARLTASRTLLQVETSVTTKMRLGNLDQRELAAQIELLKRIEGLDPSDFAIPMSIGSHYLLLQNSGSAIRWYEKALDLETRPEIALNLARAHELAGDDAEARRYREMARILDPRLGRGAAPSKKSAEEKGIGEEDS